MGRAASVVPIVGLLIDWFIQPIAFPLKSLAFLLVGTSIVNPAAGLLAFAGLAPLSTAMAGLCGAPGMGGQLLELMALGAGAGAIFHGPPPGGRTRIGAARTVHGGCRVGLCRGDDPGRRSTIRSQPR